MVVWFGIDLCKNRYGDADMEGEVGKQKKRLVVLGSGWGAIPCLRNVDMSK